MSLVNEVLRDLQTRQTRQTRGAHPLAGLRPSAVQRRKAPWVTAAIALTGVVLGLSAWRMEASDRPSRDSTKSAESPQLRVDAPENSSPAVLSVATVPMQHRTLRLATVTDFAGSRRARPQTRRSLTSDPVQIRNDPPSDAPAPTAAPEVDGAASRRPALVAGTDAPEPMPQRVVVRRANNPAPAIVAFRRGVQAQAAADVAGAVAAFRTTVELDPAHTEAWRKLATVHASAGGVDKAVEVLRRGLPVAAEPDELRLLLARLLVDSGRNAAALSVLGPTVASPARHPSMAAFRAAVLQRDGRHAESAELYETLVALRPTQGAWWVGLAIARETMGDTAVALSAYRQAAASVPLAPSLARYADQRIASLQVRSP